MDFCLKLGTVAPLSEIELRERDVNKIYFLLETDRDFYVLVYTTTPWSLLANRGLMYSPEISYALFEWYGKQVLAREGLELEHFHKVRKISIDEFADFRYKNL